MGSTVSKERHGRKNEIIGLVFMRWRFSAAAHWVLLLPFPPALASHSLGGYCHEPIMAGAGGGAADRKMLLLS